MAKNKNKFTKLDGKPPTFEEPVVVEVVEDKSDGFVSLKEVFPEECEKIDKVDEEPIEEPKVKPKVESHVYALRRDGYYCEVLLTNEQLEDYKKNRWQSQMLR